MSDKYASILKVQAFPRQKLKDLPQNKDIEISLIPKQVIEFQAEHPDRNLPTISVNVDASSRSQLHYTPANCQAGKAACFQAPGKNEFWIPQVQKPNSTFNVSGLTSPLTFRLPKSFFDPAHPLQMIAAEGNQKPSLKLATKYESPNPGSSIPKDLDDFFIAMPDATNVMSGSNLKEGAHIYSELSELQKSMVRSLIKEVVSAGGAILDDADLVKDFWFQGSFYFKNHGGKSFVIFKGYSGLRQIFRGTRYSLDKNYARFSILTIARNPWDAAKAGIPKATRGTMVGFLFMGIVNTWTWLSEDSESRFISDLLIEIGSDAIKAVLGGVVAAAAIGLGIMFTGITAPVILVVAGTAILGIVIGVGFDFMDEKIGLTDSVKKVGRKVEANTKNLWEEFVEEPVNLFFQRCEWEVRKAYRVPGG